RDAVGPDASGDEIVHRCAGPALAERQVVVNRPALVGVAFDQDQPTRVRLHQISVLVEDLRVFSADLVRIELEANVPKVRLRGELLRVWAGGALGARVRAAGRGADGATSIGRSTHRAAG